LLIVSSLVILWTSSARFLNFGISAPIDVQFVGNDVMGNLAIAQKVEARIREIPGAVDTHIYQRFNQPRLDLDVDRSKAGQSGLGVAFQEA
jgi:Cu/Ag efflux pump CusA